MSLARQHRASFEAISAAAASPFVVAGDAPSTPAPAAGVEQAIAQVRLVGDRRTLHDIQSLERKLEAKAVMLPEYGDYIAGVLQAAEETGQGVQDEVLATIMVWRIDVGQIVEALPLIDYVLRFDVKLPAHFQRTPACLITEEIAEAALKLLLAAGDAVVPLDVLEQVEQLIDGHDMPDEVRAKLDKAIGLTLARQADQPDEGSGIAGAQRAAMAAALEKLRRAQGRDPRAGVKKVIERLDRALKPADAPKAAAPVKSAAKGKPAPKKSPSGARAKAPAPVAAPGGDGQAG